MSRDGETRGLELGRRAFLGGGAAVVGGIEVGAVGDVAADEDHTVPHVYTRGHYDITWYGSVYRTDGHTATDYDARGSIPGLDGPAGDELFVHAHGWRNDPDDAIESFEAIDAALSANGYDHPVVGYSWDSDTLYTRWWKATEIAERNGGKLARFLYDYAEANPDVPLRVCSHSLGARVALRAVEILAENGYTDVVASLTLLGGAADNDAVSTDGRYGATIAAGTGRTDNFWKRDDATLEWAYSTAEFDSAVGEEGCEGPEPRNYTDHNVDDVASHTDYYREGTGCVDEVVAQF